jgi:MtrB/PioB family decaheme-associated outer membrane protein
MKTSVIMAVVFLLAPVAARPQQLSAEASAGAQLFDVSPNSSKVNEYRDLDDGFYLYQLRAEGETGPYFLRLGGTNVGREDQNIVLRGGRHGLWDVRLEWDELPHRLSNKAQTPYLYLGGGEFRVPATVPVETRELVPTADQQRANDLITEAYLSTQLRPVRLRNDREKASAAFTIAPFERWSLRLSASNEDRSGNKIGYGPIGDRPPRTLNIQMTEPIDYRTQEVRAEVGFTGDLFQAGAAYFLSRFDTDLPAMTWQNIYTSAPGTSEEWAGTTPRSVATFGRRALPQDNLYQNASLTLGVALPLDSRLSATAAWGRAEQDERLLPYSTLEVLDAVAAGDGLAWNDAAKLPRADADAQVETWLVNVDYAINPLRGLNLRAFYRFYDLDNETPTSEWRYVTQDTAGLTGGVSYINKRRNLAFDYDKQNYGLTAGYLLPVWRTNVGLGFEREEVDRAFREADTDENIYTLSVRSRPARPVALRVRYQLGDRKANGYEGDPTRATYWYAPAEAGLLPTSSDAQFTFENHPDTRRWDVTDRLRHLVDVLVTATPMARVDLSASYRFRTDDYDSDVRPSQPLLEYAGVRPLTDEDRNALSPGRQIGVLDDERHTVGLDVAVALVERLRVNAFASLDRANVRQRGFEFDENFKATPTGVAATAPLRPWIDPNGQWFADIKDTTYTIGVGSGFALLPTRLALDANYTFSQGRVEIDYSGFGTQSGTDPSQTFADTFQFGFRSPPTVRNVRHTAGAALGYRVTEQVTLSLGYMYERFKIRDWAQETSTPWFEAVNGNEFLLRDTSQSTQWGNRLPNLGSYLAPGYEAHLASLAVIVKI